MTTHKTMDELAQGIREASAVAAEKRGYTMTARQMRGGMDAETEAAITYIREHFEMVEVGANYLLGPARNPTPYDREHRRFYVAADHPGICYVRSHILVPTPEPEPEPDVRETMRHAAFEAKELLDGFVARGLFDERAAINRVRSQLGAALKEGSR